MKCRGGCFSTTPACLPRWLGVSSVSGAGGAGYCGSKHAVVGLTKSAALRYAAQGVRVNAVCPGAIVTPMTDAVAKDPQGAAFMVWLTMLLFLDLILLGIMIQGHVAPEVAVTVALANPLQVFRTAALAMFDPQLIVLGPSAYVILDLFGTTGYQIYALLYPLLIGSLCALAGYLTFRRSDLP
ncbi:SDR family oxidoreductase, partial [bacterium]|nr:SDR family oxidoreductase [bacterium]